MAISFPCPGCNKKLNAKDELAGKRGKCPHCGQVFAVPGGRPVPTVRTDPRTSKSLIEAIHQGDIAVIAREMHRRDFTLIQDSAVSAEEGMAPLIMEVEGFPALVAFSSQEHAMRFVGAEPELLNEGSVTTFVVSGEHLLAGQPEGFGVVLNDESEDSAVLPPDLMEKIKRIKVEISADGAAEEESPEGIQASAIRKQVVAFLGERGFRPADSLPLPDMNRKIRPASEIAARLLALAALFTWASAPESAVASKKIQKHIKKNGLHDWLTEEEAEILSLSRDEAQEAHGNAIGWRLENIWPLAWVLGYESEPRIDGSQIPPPISREILFKFLEGPEGTIKGLLGKIALRSAEEIIALEDRFYCAHNAVRGAQLGEKNVAPEGFDPIADGGVIHERRHALTWCLSPETGWEDTDLST
jgi:hypothetical protein